MSEVKLPPSKHKLGYTWKEVLNIIRPLKIHHKTTIMWNLKRKHKVEICDLKGNKLKAMWLNKDGSNKLAIDAKAEKLR